MHNINLTQRQNSPRGPRPTVLDSVYVTLEPELREQMFRSGGKGETKAVQFAATKQRLRRNCARGAAINRVLEEVGKGAPSYNSYSPAKFQGDGQSILQQMVTD
ncbi:hypothetical protein TNCV_4977751 [Trichonephila clavipes]|nr:hypothetical protein TNCV_4977751 [Trichonephila clavipes]